VSKAPPAQDGADKRRSTRLTLALPIKVKGIDALHEPFTEQTRTVMVSCHGCKYIAKNYVPRGHEVTLEIPRGNPKLPPREITAKVIWVQRGNHTREMLHIGLNLDVPGNVWDIPMPPDDWFPPPGEEPFVLEEPPPPPVFAAPPPPTPTVTLTASWDASEILLMAGRAEGREAEVAAALAMAKSETATAVAVAVEEEVEVVKKSSSTPMTAEMQEALKTAVEQVSQSAVEKFIARASEQMLQIVEEARRTYHVATQELDSKIEKAVQEALAKMNGNGNGNGASQTPSRHGRNKRKR